MWRIQSVNVGFATATTLRVQAALPQPLLQRRQGVLRRLLDVQHLLRRDGPRPDALARLRLLLVLLGDAVPVVGPAQRGGILMLIKYLNLMLLPTHVDVQLN